MAGVLIIALILARQHSNSQERLDQLESEVTALSDRSTEQDELTAERLGQITGQITLLREKLDKLAPEEDARLVATAARDSPLSLPEGYYALTSRDADPVETEITNYHLKTSIVGQEIHMGLARQGWISWYFYFDYNNDGRVDTDIVYEVIQHVPFVGQALAILFNPERSQRVYERFLNFAGRAEPTPIRDIMSEGGGIAQELLYVVDTEAVGAWIRNKMEGQPPATPEQQLEPEDLSSDWLPRLLGLLPFVDSESPGEPETNEPETNEPEESGSDWLSRLFGWLPFVD